ncbi:MAG: lipid A export permease/ATP-binding protein MsbA [Pseudomonadota bacterium]|nr:lipid A export permease/ATP-binding protein MsbA [Gammaproteobacteria bacterium]MBU1927039.1 lipid A export permease/ATP-binding protein MsbA [Gammaproteobacteria bacterium]
MTSSTTQSGFQLYWRLLRYAKRYWWAFGIAILSNIFYSAVDSGFTYLLKPVLDKGFIDRDLHFIRFLPYLVFSAFIFRSIANFGSSYFMAVVSRGVVKNFRQDIFRHLMRLPAAYYDNNSSGQILSTIVYNVDQVSYASADALTDFVQSGCLVIGLLVVMFTISWRLSVLYLCTAPVITVAVKLSGQRLRRINKHIQDQMGDVTTIAAEAIEGYKVVRSFGGQPYEMKKFEKATERNLFKELKIIVTKTLSVSGVQLVAGIALAVTVYLAISHSASTMLSAGSFVSLIAAMLALLKPLKNLTNVNATIQRGIAAAHSVFELLDRSAEEDRGTIHIERVRGDIVFDGVSFRYPRSERDVLKNVSFTIQSGQMVALVGHSGGGKSTLVNLLQRFYNGFDGTITIDGVDIHQYVLSEYRQQFSVVSQHVTLFNDTVARNVAYGQANAPEGQVIAALKAANAWNFVKQMPEGIDTLVGENGVLLSGGQRQRIAIARAIFKNAPIFVLDEATSALDTESERQIQSALDNLMRHQTTLVIAHRLSTIEHADVILVLQEGRIVEIGNHATLLEKGGAYAHLYRLQFREEDK